MNTNGAEIKQFPGNNHIKGALKIMAWTKAKTAVVVGMAAILAVGTAAIVIHHRNSGSQTDSPFSKTQQLSSDEEAQLSSTTGNTPEQVAKSVFDACSQGDWTAFAKFWPEGGRPLDEGMKSKLAAYYGGSQVISLGKPFKAWSNDHNKAKYGSFFVPYEIRLKSGEIKKWQLAVRCDNSENRWYWDGGL
jgi:hypothetical protein